MKKNNDEEHLDLLAVFHYILGGMIAFIGCFPLIHLAIGIFISFGLFAAPQQGSGANPLPAVAGLFFIIVPSLIITAFWATATAVIFAGRYLKARTHYTYCFVMAVVLCMFTPLGTILGVFSIIVLSRESVKELFEGTYIPDENKSLKE